MQPNSVSTEPNILIVDDDATVIQALRKALVGLGALHFATGGADALRLARANRPDLILLDAEMPEMSGFRICELLREDADLLGVPVIFITQHGDQEIEQAAFEAGAVDFISKPLRLPIVAMRAKTHLRLRAATERLRSLATTDALTGLGNRRAFDDTAQKEWKRAQRNAAPLSILMIEIDLFKDFTERHGHAAADECLRDVGALLRANFQRPVDFLARYGHEEFAAILPDTPSAGALLVAQRVLRDVEQACAPRGSDQRLPATVSIGASSLDQSCDAWFSLAKRARYASHQSAPSVGDLVEAATMALEAAKRGGRRQQCFRTIDVAIENRLSAEGGLDGESAPRLSNAATARA